MRYSSVYDAFAATCERTLGDDFLVTEKETATAYDVAPGTVSWSEAGDKVERLRKRYLAAGWGGGHRVGLLLENRPEFFYHWLALNSLGVSVVPISAEMRLAELEYLIRHSEINLVVSLDRKAAEVRQAGAQAGVQVRTIGPVESGIPAPLTPPANHAHAPAKNTECALLYTSGTTGLPKGCVLDNAYFLRCGEWYSHLSGVCEYRRDEERVMTPLPLNHMNAMANSAMVVLMAGGALIQLDRFHPNTWLQSARESSATIVHYLGVMPAMLLSASPRESDRQHRIRWGFGAGVDRENHALFERRFGFPLIEAWAMTETGAAAVVMANKEPRHVGESCFGRAEDYMQARVVDDAGADVPAGTPGELLVRSAGDDPRRNFFRGYLKNPEATSEAWRDGWFHTGDIVRRDADGNFFFVDRKKNVIRRSGENIAAVEVEGVLNRHPQVKVSAVAAVPDKLRGNEVFACIVADAGAEAVNADLARDIVRHCLAHLAYYKAPGFIAFVPELPLTTSQKIRRGTLKELVQSLHDSGRFVDTRDMKKRQG